MEHPFRAIPAQHGEIGISMDHLGVENLGMKRQGRIHVTDQKIDAESP